MADYQNREIDSKFEEVHHRFDDQEKTLNSILGQTTRTNGRVNSLETWQNRMIGAIIVISAITTGILIPLALTFLNGGIEQVVQKGVQRELSTYEIQVK